jgi:hypothetical protein
MIRKPTTVALLVNPSNPTSELQTADMQVAARATSQQLTVLRASNQPEIDAAFASIVHFVGGDGALGIQCNQILACSTNMQFPRSPAGVSSVQRRPE